MPINIATALCRSDLLGTEGKLEFIETHISWVILAGEFAYKIKKPVDLGFVDFTTLEKRKYFCMEEVRLNRRLAPDLYIGVVKICGTVESPILDGVGNELEYAVKMRRFPQDQELSQMVNAGLPGSESFQQLAEDLAGFHEVAAVAGQDSEYATPKLVARSELDNFRVIRSKISDRSLLKRFENLESWTRKSLIRLDEAFLQRMQNGRIRECHGDLHLGNLVFLNDRIVAFDCLEFNPELRWIDVASEIAFLLMDLYFHDHRARALLVLDRYLECSGDYELIPLLDHYLVYRAMVRAKICCLQQPSKDWTKSQQNTILKYVSLAEKFTVPRQSPRLIITCGLSGSGKTWISGLLVERSEIIRIRSDVIRKRHHGLHPMDSSQSEFQSGIYSDNETKYVYTELGRLAELILEAGFSVIVDATFLAESQRRRFSALAKKKSVPFVIIKVEAPYDVLVSRISSRGKLGKDASEADLNVLNNQYRNCDPLSSGELHSTLNIDSTATKEQILESITPLLD
ncbi:MAG: AAA family ATPase [bacterium]